jgi:HSP20 family protein
LAIARWRPMNDLMGLHSSLDRLFGDMLGDWGYGSQQQQQMRGDGGGERGLPIFHLPVDVMETDNGYMIQAPVPGFRPEDVEVTFSDGVLTINARRQEEKTEEEGNYVRRELAWGNFMRQIALPGDIQADGIQATFEDGILSIEVPRAPKPEPARIQVQRGSGQSGEQRGQLRGDQGQEGAQGQQARQGQQTTVGQGQAQPR